MLLSSKNINSKYIESLLQSIVSSTMLNTLVKDHQRINQILETVNSSFLSTVSEHEIKTVNGHTDATVTDITEQTAKEKNYFNTCYSPYTSVEVLERSINQAQWLILYKDKKNELFYTPDLLLNNNSVELSKIYPDTRIDVAFKDGHYYLTCKHSYLNENDLEKQKNQKVYSLTQRMKSNQRQVVNIFTNKLTPIIFNPFGYNEKSMSASQAIEKGHSFAFLNWN